MLREYRSHMEDTARARIAGPSYPQKGTAPPSPHRGRLIILGSLGLVVAALVVIFGSYHARRAFVGDQTICIVTAESLSYDGNSYNGGDHPLNPQIGDRYVGSSGCNAFETQCTRQIKPLGTHLVC